jgi:catechol 2,3-dioxygenase-like lactoylglutathione lyase family enzyme
MSARPCHRLFREKSVSNELAVLLDRYETGGLSRREFLGAVAALTLLPSHGPTEPAIGVAKQLNHATLFVQNVDASRAFYQNLFGMPILTPQPPGVNLATGSGFVGLYPAPAGEPSRIDHLCFGLERFDATSTHEKLAARNIESVLRVRGDTNELYFADPDGIRIQLQDVRYRGGIGPLGDRASK